MEIFMNNIPLDTEYLILENIYDSGERKILLRQRELALKAGTSLGLTNAILKRLTQKGWIIIKKLNRRNIQYAVTLEGVNEIIHRSYGYFKRTIRNVVYYKDMIDAIVNDAKKNKINAVILVGSSDLDFILEYACQCYGISFLKTAIPDMVKTQTSGVLKVYAESINFYETPESNSAEANEQHNSFYLSKLVMKQEMENNQLSLLEA